MTVESLLLPRYKVIADFPMMEDSYKWNVGDVVQLVVRGMPIYFTADGGYIEENFFTDYPHLFKKLEWQEDRLPEEMPEYVKVCEKIRGCRLPNRKFIRDFLKVPEWTIENRFMKAVLVRSKKGTIMIDASYLTPCTEEEYNAYINKQK